MSFQNNSMDAISIGDQKPVEEEEFLNLASKDGSNVKFFSNKDCQALKGIAHHLSNKEAETAKRCFDQAKQEGHNLPRWQGLSKPDYLKLDTHPDSISGVCIQGSTVLPAEHYYRKTLDYIASQPNEKISKTKLKNLKGLPNPTGGLYYMNTAKLMYLIPQEEEAREEKQVEEMNELEGATPFKRYFEQQDHGNLFGWVHGNFVPCKRTKKGTRRCYYCKTTMLNKINKDGTYTDSDFYCTNHKGKPFSIAAPAVECPDDGKEFA